MLCYISNFEREKDICGKAECDPFNKSYVHYVFHLCCKFKKFIIDVLKKGKDCHDVILLVLNFLQGFFC